MKLLFPLLVVVLMAGCTAADDAKQALADAQESLAEAQRDAADAKAKLDRIRSSNIVREEVLQLNLTVRLTNGTLSFEPEASRLVDGVATPIPRANLTDLPDVKLEAAAFGFSAQCEPLTCNARVPGQIQITIAWSDKPDERVTVRDGAVLSRSDARVLVTTAAGDVTA